MPKTARVIHLRPLVRGMLVGTSAYHGGTKSSTVSVARRPGQFRGFLTTTLLTQAHQHHRAMNKSYAVRNRFMSGARVHSEHSGDHQFDLPGTAPVDSCVPR